VQIRELKGNRPRYGLVLIEDASESFGAKIEESRVGTFGDQAMFKLSVRIRLSTGDGVRLRLIPSKVATNLN